MEITAFDIKLQRTTVATFRLIVTLLLLLIVN